eukprot:1473477-Heterocapsa_arctica.AAC.1
METYNYMAAVVPTPDCQTEDQPPRPDQSRAVSQPDDWGSRLLDLKGVARPPQFDGKTSAWGDWKFKILAIAELLDLAEFMELAEAQP